MDHYLKRRFYDVEFKINTKKKDVELNNDGQIINY